MTTIKAKVSYTAAGVLLTVFALYPYLKAMMREQRVGLLLSPEDVKAACGKPQSDDIYTLTYIDGDRRVELQFMGSDHRMFLNRVKWSSSKASGQITQVTRQAISDYVKYGGLPTCLEQAAR